MNGMLSIGAAWLLGLAASGHCVVMCGGISTALSIATARHADGRPRLTLLAGYQIGRITSYALAGLLFAGVLGSVIALLDNAAVRYGLRILTALSFLFAAAVAFGRFRDISGVLGRRAWSTIAPLGRRLLPVSSPARALAFGMLWGWMPCGFVYSVLLIATLQADPLRGALIMAAFGLGMSPALLAFGSGAQWITRAFAPIRTRQIAGSLLLLSAVITLAGPWLVHLMPTLNTMLPFDCTPIPIR